MILFVISWAVNLFSSLFLSFFTWKQARGRKAQKLWAIFCFFVAIASLGFAGSNLFHDKSTALFFIKIINIAAAFLPAIFLHFVYAFLQREKSKRLYYLCYGGSILFSLSLLGDLLLRDIAPNPPFRFWLVPGPLYLPFMVYFILPFIAGHWLIMKALRQSAGRQRLQYEYFFTATTIGILGSITTFIPAFFPNIYPFGVLLIPLYCFIIAFAIIRYQLMDIEVIIKKTIVFAGIVAAAVSAVAFPFALIQAVIGKALGIPNPFVLMALGIATAVLIYRPVERILVNITDQYLFQKKFDYRKVLQYASEGLSHVNSLKHQLKLVTHFLTSRARIKSTAIYMPENDGGHGFILMEHRSFDGIAAFPERLPFDSQVLIYLKKERRRPFLEFYNIEDEARKYKQNASTFQYDLNGLRDEIRKLNAHLIIPSFYQDELQGILVLGEKRSEESYHEEDIHLFQTIAQESAIAFENARKHDELVEQKEKLARVNEELRRTQEEVIQAKEAAAVAALSAGISHEIGNNILGLTGAIQEIKETFDRVLRLMNQWHHSGEPVGDSEKYELFMLLKSGREALGHARKTSLHIEDVVTTLSQIAKGKYARMVRISLRVFLKNAVNASMLRTYGDRVKSQALEKPPELEMDKDLPPIKGHTELLNAVFINLFKNAIHAMNGVSPKKIKIRALRDPEEHDMVRIEFSDNGSGIPPEVLPRIFDYGFTTKRAEGEGKGLFNVKTIIEREHKGAIGVQSESGKGTTFIIKIPAYQGEDEDYSDPAASGA